MELQSRIIKDQVFGKGDMDSFSHLPSLPMQQDNRSNDANSATIYTHGQMPGTEVKDKAKVDYLMKSDYQNK